MTTEGVPSLEPIVSETTVSVIARRLRDAISEGVYPPGARLTEQEIARQLEVSRGPLREAIQRLVQEGIVTNIPNRGSFVKILDEESVSALFVARLACESTAIRVMMADPNPKHIERLTSLAGELSEALKGADWPAAGEIDLAFHEALVQSADNPHLDRMFQTLKVEALVVHRLMENAYPDVGHLADENFRVLEAIKSGDLQRALDEIQVHMAEGVRRLTGADIPPWVA